MVIIGNGIAGITLAQQVRFGSKCRITLVSAESATHFSRPALMYVYMGHLRYEDILPYPGWYFREKKLEQQHDRVLRIDAQAKTLQLQSGERLSYDVLAIASGSVAAFYNWPGQDIAGVQGLVSLQDLEQMEENTQGIQEAVLVGGGLIGVEMAEMLRSRGIAVTILVRDKLYWNSVLPEDEARLVTKHIQEHGVELLLEDELQEILPDAQGRVQRVRTKRGKELPCQFVGIATGVKPNVAFLEESGLDLDRGILVNEYFETNLPQIYALGDCAQFRQPEAKALTIEQQWYSARLHGETLAKNLLGKRSPYRRGPWFNSAKFFDIEYQAYGLVPSALGDELDSLYWQHEAKKKSIRLIYNRQSAELRGVILLSVRYRHDLCHHWLQNKYTIHEVIKEISAANFDPEFFQRYEQELQRQYLKRFPEKTAPAKPGNWWKLRHRFGLFSDTENC